LGRLGLIHRSTFVYGYLRKAVDAPWPEVGDPNHPRIPAIATA
jgi:hypothetical protein